ncbi:glycosyltransferase [Streptomyces sp. VRA16 Mangrove soil]|uniref:glycosyltransferase family 2 protein n=1 Tax=Streptomyces sp. VRA16 Mangrove soil TaxID=2817434 RepID=UPI001A9E3216|nr:glycosyltransferase [Streptomyces sp. VRA16 Mangrove soil]MBO1337574.1 glycosyltransferase [Streptomyces sp. VRA16 Mangrove soil]
MQNIPGRTPDVSVVVAVYNTMPYLTECLTSLVGQTIGLDGRMEIIAVDDGSTDGGEKELDRFAGLHPDVFTVVHQPNSGGPAAPSNRALDLARGRYVFFVGADDRLGPEALERLVDAADRLESDVVLGRMVGVNGRTVPRAVFKSSQDDVRLEDSALPWALSNTKLFRRELIERHGLRYPEEYPVLSDQPFTLEACFRAARISVLADYDYYFAVRREDDSNVTFRHRMVDRLRATTAIMALTERMTEPGRGRDWINQRHTTWELAPLVAPELLELSDEEQRTVCEGLGALMRKYGSDYALRKLDRRQRLLMRLAERGATQALLDVVRHPQPPLHLEGERAYAAHPCFRDPELGLPDEWFDITAETRSAWAGQFLAPADVRWDDTGLRIVTSSSLPDLAAFGAECVVVDGTAQGQPAAVELDCREQGTLIRVALPVAGLFPRGQRPVPAQTVRLSVRALGVTHDIPLPVVPPARRHWHRTRAYVVAPRPERNGAMTLAVAPVAARQLAKGLARRLRPGDQDDA